jgi:hypothetical protein
VLASFSFAESFASGALAKPAIALSDRGLLRLPAGDDPPQRVLQAWAGVREAPGAEEEDAGVVIDDPRKFYFAADFDRGGGEVRRVTASAHDFRCMAHLLELFDPPPGRGVRAIAKPIVFCPTNAVARRCLAVFLAMAAQRAREAEERGDARRAEIYRSIGAAHVFQSDTSAPGLGQSYERRQQLVWRFRGALRFALFNVDLLSTGVDLPCCDCAYQHSPSKVGSLVVEVFESCVAILILQVLISLPPLPLQFPRRT